MIHYLLSAMFVLFIIEVNNLIISKQSVIRLSYCSLFIYSQLYSIFSQYLVSLASFKDILSLCLKSSLLSANSASHIFAPILVPDFNICDIIGCSAKDVVLLNKNLDILTTLIAKFNPLSLIILSSFNGMGNQLLIVNY